MSKKKKFKKPILKEEKRGRPEWIPNEETLKTVESLAAQGLTKEQIANCLGISYQTLNEKSKEYSDFSDAIKRGSAKGIATISNALFSSAKTGNTTAQLFYLKCRGGWKETQVNEHSGIDGKPIEHRGYVAVVPPKATSIAEWSANNLAAATGATDEPTDLPD